MEEELLLVKRAKRGDAEAFATLYAEIYENMFRFALYTMRNTADAEDAVSETVVDAFASQGGSVPGMDLPNPFQQMQGQAAGICETSGHFRRCIDGENRNQGTGGGRHREEAVF